MTYRSDASLVCLPGVRHAHVRTSPVAPAHHAHEVSRTLSSSYALRLLLFSLELLNRYIYMWQHGAQLGMSITSVSRKPNKVGEVKEKLPSLALS